jgi:uncharacterized protein YerC
MGFTKKINPNTFEPDAEKLTLKEKYDHLTKVCKNQEKLNTSILKDILNVFLQMYHENIKLKKQIETLENQLKEEKNKRVNVSETCQRVNTLTPKTKQIPNKDIFIIKMLRDKGLSYREITRQTGWSIATVSRVLNGVYDEF